MTSNGVAEADGEAAASDAIADGSVGLLDTGLPVVPEIKEVLVPAVAASSRDDGWAALLSKVGWYVVNNDSSFDSRNYGYPRLGPLVRDMPFIDVREVPDANGTAQLWVRLAEGA